MPDAPLVAPEEFTAAMRDSGSLERGSITSVHLTEHLETSISYLRFLRATYSPDCSPALPGRLLLKWPLAGSPAPEGRAAEPTFYREHAPEVGSPPIVRVLAAAPAASEQQWVLLEDLRSSHTNPPWPERPSDLALEGAVSSLARLHAHWWEAPTLGTRVGTLHSAAGLGAMVEGIAAQLPGFLDHLGDSLSGADRAVLETVFASSLAPWMRLVDCRALTLAHGDAHTWNFLFPRSGRGDPYLIDWQTWHLDLGARDLAFMIALHWGRDVRKRLELPLLRLYHRRLEDQGVAGYSFDDLWLDYRRCAVRNLTFPIIFWARGLPPGAWRGRLECALAAYHDLDGADFI